jgi:hypothetical protein
MIRAIGGSFARELGLRCLGYSSWLQQFRDVQKFDLFLGQRPLVSVVSVTDSDEEPLVLDTDYTVNYSSPSIYRPDGWLFLNATSLPSIQWHWNVTYFAGWWMPGSTGGAPAGASTFPDELQEAALVQLRWDFSKAKLSPFVRRMSKDGASVEFLTAADAGVARAEAASGPTLLLPEVRAALFKYRGLAI